MRRRNRFALRGFVSAALVAGAGLAGSTLDGLTAGAATTATLFASPTGAGTSCSSSSPCSLATVITQARADNGATVTAHLAAGTYNAFISVTTGVFASLAIVGAGDSGATPTILDGEHAQRVVRDVTGHPMSISSVEIIDGNSGFGACVLNEGTLSLTSVLLNDCIASSAAGGAVDDFGSLHLSTSTISTSSAVTEGGAVAVLTSSPAVLRSDLFVTDHAPTGGAIDAAGATVTVTGSTFRHDDAGRYGGGIRAGTSSTLTVDSSTFATGSATGGAGVGVYGSQATFSNDVFTGSTGTTGGGIVEQKSSSVVVRSSTFANNKVTSWGGGIDNFGGSLNVSASTFIDDAAGGAGGGVVTETGGTQTLTNDTFATDSAHTGGAVANTTTTNHTTMVDDTLSHDTATGHGDGVWAATGSVTFSDTIFDAAGCAKAGLASLADHGYNVATTHTCTSAPTSISTSSTIGLGHLAANTSTGPQTMAITPTSSAFEVVPSAACTVTVTQRGAPRPGAAGKNCDAGAYEYQLTGYDLVGSDGGVFVFNPPGRTGGFFGSLPGIHVVPNKPVVGIVPTVTDTGYFLVAADGGVFAFGNAPFLGSLPGIKVTPNLPIVGIVAANTDKGYFLVGADGGVYAFGTVPFLGSLPGKGVSAADVIGIAATPSGSGYWVVQATGKVTAFGTAQAFTTTATTSPVAAIAGTPTGGGYWLVTKEGGVYPYGNATKQGKGTLPAIRVTPNLPVIGIVRVAATVGYWLIGADGGIFAFGTAPFVGSLPGLTPPVDVTNIVGAVPN